MSAQGIIDFIVSQHWAGESDRSLDVDDDMALERNAIPLSPLAVKQSHLLCRLARQSVVHDHDEAAVLGLASESGENASEAFFAFLLCATSYAMWCLEHQRVAGGDGAAQGPLSNRGDTLDPAFSRWFAPYAAGFSPSSALGRYGKLFGPAVSRLWRRPALVAALGALSDLLWRVQAAAHGEQPLACEAPCPVCVAAALDGEIAAEACWWLLRYRTVWGGGGGGADGAGRTNVMWRHALACARSALFNGAAASLRRVCHVWVPGLPPPSDDSSSTPSLSLPLLLLLLANLLAHDETAARRGEAAVARSLAALCAAHCRGPVDAARMLSGDGYGAVRHVPGAAAAVSSFVALVGCVPLSALAPSSVDSPDASCLSSCTLLQWAAAQGWTRLLRWVLDLARDASAAADEDQGEDERDDPVCCVIAMSPDAKQRGASEPTAAGSEYRAVVVSSADGVEESDSRAAVLAASAAASPRAPAKEFMQPSVLSRAMTAAVAAGDAESALVCLMSGASPHGATLPPPSHPDVPASLYDLLLSPAACTDATAAAGDAGTGASPAAAPGLRRSLELTLCRATAARLLGGMAWRLWDERVRRGAAPPPPRPTSLADETASAWAAAHDRVLRLALAGLQYDPLEPLSRLAAVGVLAAKLRRWLSALEEGEAVQVHHHPAAEHEAPLVRYYSAALRAYGDLTRGEAWRQMLGIGAGSRQLRLLSAAREARAARLRELDAAVRQKEAEGEEEEEASLDLGGEIPADSDNAAAEADAHRLVAATEAVAAEVGSLDERLAEHTSRLAARMADAALPLEDSRPQRLRAPDGAITHVLVRLHPTATVFVPSEAAGRTLLLWRAALLQADSSVWVRLPPGVSSEEELAASGGGYGVVDGAAPLACPAQSGDLVVFSLAPRMATAVQVVSGRAASNSTRVVRLPGGRELRCVRGPVLAPREGGDRGGALHWLQTRGAQASESADVLSVLAASGPLTRLWCGIAAAWQAPLWMLCAEDGGVAIGETLRESPWSPVRAVAGALLKDARARLGGDPQTVVARRVFPFVAARDEDGGEAEAERDALAGCGSSAGALYLLRLARRIGSAGDDGRGVGAGWRTGGDLAIENGVCTHCYEITGVFPA